MSLLLKSEDSQAELTLWMPNSYYGPIEITIGGCVKYRKGVISTQRGLEIIIDQLRDGECYFAPLHGIELPQGSVQHSLTCEDAETATLR